MNFALIRYTIALANRSLETIFTTGSIIGIVGFNVMAAVAPYLIPIIIPATPGISIVMLWFGVSFFVGPSVVYASIVAVGLAAQLVFSAAEISIMLVKGVVSALTTVASGLYSAAKWLLTPGAKQLTPAEQQFAKSMTLEAYNKTIEAVKQQLGAFKIGYYQKNASGCYEFVAKFNPGVLKSSTGDILPHAAASLVIAAKKSKDIRSCLPVLMASHERSEAKYFTLDVVKDTLMRAKSTLKGVSMPSYIVSSTQSASDCECFYRDREGDVSVREIEVDSNNYQEVALKLRLFAKNNPELQRIMPSVLKNEAGEAEEFNANGCVTNLLVDDKGIPRYFACPVEDGSIVSQPCRMGLSEFVSHGISGMV